VARVRQQGDEVEIRRDDPTAPYVADLLAHHLEELRSVMAERAFALDATGLSAATVTFWTACESTRDQLQKSGVRNVKIIRYGVHTEALPELAIKELTEPLQLAAVSRLARWPSHFFTRFLHRMSSFRC